MKAKGIGSILLASFLMLLAQPCHPYIASGTFTSTALGPLVVTWNGGGGIPPYPGIAKWDHASLMVTFDTAAVNSSADPNIGVYTFTRLPSTISVTVDGTTFAHSYDMSDLIITVYNNSLSSAWGMEDAVVINGKINGSNPNYLSFGFSGAFKDVIDSVALPSLVDLMAFSYLAGRVDVYPPGSTIHTTLPFATPTPGVPLPSGLLLFASGLTGLAALRGWLKK